MEHQEQQKEQDMQSAIRQAKQLLEREGYTCVMRRGSQSYASRERGIAPLLQWIDTGIQLQGAVAVDKVVGKAAAYLYVQMQLAAVHAGVISQPALDVLLRYDIAVTYDALVPAIRNRAGTGFCPMETAVLHTDHPQEAEQILRRKRAEMLQQMAQADRQDAAETAMA